MARNSERVFLVDDAMLKLHRRWKSIQFFSLSVMTIITKAKEWKRGENIAANLKRTKRQ